MASRDLRPGSSAPTSSWKASAVSAVVTAVVALVVLKVVLGVVAGLLGLVVPVGLLAAGIYLLGEGRSGPGWAAIGVAALTLFF